MSKYTVIFEEIIHHTFVVDAETKGEAAAKAQALWDNCAEGVEEESLGGELYMCTAINPPEGTPA